MQLYESRNQESMLYSGVFIICIVIWAQTVEADVDRTQERPGLTDDWVPSEIHDLYDCPLKMWPVSVSIGYALGLHVHNFRKLPPPLTMKTVAEALWDCCVKDIHKPIELFQLKLMHPVLKTSHVESIAFKW